MEKYKYIIEVADKIEIGPISWRVIHKNKIFLRIALTKNSERVKFPFELMTATASDNSGIYRGLNDEERNRAVIAAQKVVKLQFDVESSVSQDWKGREYVPIALIDQEGVDTTELTEMIDLFFQYYYEPNALDNDLIDIYNGICVEDGEDVYLSDGMWLTSDGRLIEK